MTKRILMVFALLALLLGSAATADAGGRRGGPGWGRPGWGGGFYYGPRFWGPRPWWGPGWYGFRPWPLYPFYGGYYPYYYRTRPILRMHRRLSSNRILRSTSSKIRRSRYSRRRLLRPPLCHPIRASLSRASSGTTARTRGATSLTCTNVRGDG